MGWLDIVLGILLALNIISGYKKGFFEEVGGLVGLIAGLFAAMALDDLVSQFLMNAFSCGVVLANVLGFLIPFLMVFMLFVILSKVFSHFFKILSLGWMNHLAGALFSFVKGVFILSIILNIYEWADKDRSLVGQERIESSRLYKPIQKVVPDLVPIFREKADKLKDATLKENHT